MKESRRKSLDNDNVKGSRHESKKHHRHKAGKRKRSADDSNTFTEETRMGLSEVDKQSGDEKNTCRSSSKFEDSEESNVTNHSGSSSNAVGDNSNTSSGSRSRQYSSSVSKKHGISGIDFQPGLRLEAKDLGNDIWYAVKVVEVDLEEEEILIHFEKWSQRYDEWIPMDSSRLRRIEEPLGGRFTKKGGCKVFKVGDNVMATWSDSRKYPAKVKTVLSNDRYEVHFFDGFSKTIKGGRMTLLKDEELAKIEKLKPGIGPSNDVPRGTNPAPILSPFADTAESIGTKEERRERKRKLNVAELFHFKKKRVKTENTTVKSLNIGERRKRGGGFGRGRRKRHWPEQRNMMSDDTVFPCEIKTEPIDFESTKETPAEHDLQLMEQGRKECSMKMKRKYSHKVNENPTKPRRRCKVEESEQMVEDSNKFMHPKKGRKRRKYFEEGRGPSFSSVVVKREKDTEDTTSDNYQARKKEPFERDSVKSRGLVGDWEPEGEPAYIVDGSGGPRKSIIVTDTRIPPGWTRHTIQRMSGHSAGKWDVFFVCPEGRKFRTRHELRLYYEELGELFPSEKFDFSLGRRRGKAAASSAVSSSVDSGEQANTPTGRFSSHNRMGRPPGSGKGHIMLGAGGDGVLTEPGVRRVKTLLPRVRPSQSLELIEGPTTPESTRSLLSPQTPVQNVGSADQLHDTEIVGLKILKENDAYKCPKEGCNKNFRKENLLQMHIKHYHPEYNRFVASTPNVADLAYARTIGEPLEDLLPRNARSSSFLDKISRFEAHRKMKSEGLVGAGVGGGETSVFPGSSSATVERKKTSGTNRRNKVREVDGPLAVDDLADQQVTDPAVVGAGLAQGSREEGGVAKSTIKTLLPVVRLNASSVTDLAAKDGPRGSASPLDSEEYVDVTAVTPRCPGERPSVDSSPAPPAGVNVAPLGRDTPPPLLQGLGVGVSQTKSLRMVRRRHMSDFHMEPLLKKRKTAKMPELVLEDADVVTDENGSSIDAVTGISYSKLPPMFRFSQKKMPVVSLEKLPLLENGELDDRSKSPVVTIVSDTPEPTSRQSRADALRREELINCTCGYTEEDGLMIQCDLCLCWQHGLCNGIEKEEDVPDKYVCSICLNPPRQRPSKRYLHDQDWLKEGVLPSLSFRSKNAINVAQRETILKRSHELTGTLLQLRHVIHSLRVKVNIAEKIDHPKLYLWAKSWEKNTSDGQTGTCEEIQANHTEAERELLKPEAKEPKEVMPCTDHVGALKDTLDFSKKSGLCEELDIPPPTATPELGGCDPEAEKGKSSADPEAKDEKNYVTEGQCEPSGEDTTTSQDTQDTSISNTEEKEEPESESGVANECENLNEPVVLDTTIDIGTETEVATAGTELEADDDQSMGSKGAGDCDVPDTPDVSVGPNEETATPVPDDSENAGQAVDSVDQTVPGEGEVESKLQLEPSSTREASHDLQLPICQSELMQLATSLARRMQATQEPVKVARAPQPEAPIDPVECRLTLLDHIDHFHQQIESRLTSLEAQIAVLESLDPYLANDERADPQTKQTVQMLLRDLCTVRDAATLN